MLQSGAELMNTIVAVFFLIKLFITKATINTHLLFYSCCCISDLQEKFIVLDESLFYSDL